MQLFSSSASRGLGDRRASGATVREGCNGNVPDHIQWWPLNPCSCPMSNGSCTMAHVSCHVRCPLMTLLGMPQTILIKASMQSSDISSAPAAMASHLAQASHERYPDLTKHHPPKPPRTRISAYRRWQSFRPARHGSMPSREIDPAATQPWPTLRAGRACRTAAGRACCRTLTRGLIVVRHVLAVDFRARPEEMRDIYPAAY